MYRETETLFHTQLTKVLLNYIIDVLSVLLFTDISNKSGLHIITSVYLQLYSIMIYRYQLKVLHELPSDTRRRHIDQLCRWHSFNPLSLICKDGKILMHAAYRLTCTMDIYISLSYSNKYRYYKYISL